MVKRKISDIEFRKLLLGLGLGRKVEISEAMGKLRDWYNHEHYHKSIGNLHLADVYHGRAETILRGQSGSKHKQKGPVARPIQIHHQNY